MCPRGQARERSRSNVRFVEYLYRLVFCVVRLVNVRCVFALRPYPLPPPTARRACWSSAAALVICLRRSAESPRAFVFAGHHARRARAVRFVHPDQPPNEPRRAPQTLCGNPRVETW